MKRTLTLIFAVFLLISLAGCNRSELAKEKIFNLVTENYDAILAACLDRDADALYELEGIAKVDFYGGYILVYCMGAGIAPSSQDYGFYYSRENLPVAVFDGFIVCQTADLEEEGNGFQYTDQWHNVYYTEHITGNFWFYSASF